MDNIILRSEVLTITKINRKTKAKMFEHLKVGDTIKFSIPIKEAGHNRGTYATYIKATNIKTGETTHSSFNQMLAILNAFEFEIYSFDNSIYETIYNQESESIRDAISTIRNMKNRDLKDKYKDYIK